MTVSEAQHPTPFTRIELCVLSIVESQLQVLLGRREQAPFKGRWALPGGVLRIDLDSDLEQAAQRVANERIGLSLPYLRQQCAVGGNGRDPRAAWSLSVVYRALVPAENFYPTAGKRLMALRWTPVGEAMPDATLAFDHNQIVAAAVANLRAEVDRLDLPFQYLPNQFALGELQEICEKLLGRKLDKSSFRRRLEDKHILEPIKGAIRRGEANRPAQLYRGRGNEPKET